MTLIRLSFFLAILSCVGCGNDPPPAPDLNAEAMRVMELEGEWMKTLQAGDIEAAMGFIGSDPRVIVPEAPMIEGRDGVRALMEEMIRNDLDYSWKPTGAVVAPSGDMAYDWGDSYIHMPDGSTLEGKYMVIWVKEGGEWKVAVDMVN